MFAGWPAVSTPVLRGLAGKPGEAKHALEELYGVTDFKSSTDEGKPSNLAKTETMHCVQCFMREQPFTFQLAVLQCAC